MYTDEQTVIHHTDRLEELRVTTELLRQERTLLRAQLEHLVAVDPVEVFEDRTGVLFRLFFRVHSPDGTPLEIVRLVNVLVGREEVVHDDKVNLSAPGKLDTMQTIKARQQGVGVALDVCIVLLENREQKLVLRVANGLYDEAVVAGKVKERARLARRPQFGEDVLGGEREKVISGIELEIVLAQLPEHPGGIIFKLEIILCRGR